MLAMQPHARPLRLLCLALLAFVFLLSFVAPAAAQPSPAYTDLANDTPLLVSLAVNATAYFRFVSPAVNSSDAQQTALVSVSAELGFPSLYVSLSNPTPSAASFDYAASWQTGGVVSLSGMQAPYVAYVAVAASPFSRVNCTLLVTAYDATAKQSVPVPLPDAEPVASAIAAGEYRYFAYTVPANVTSATVSLTETYGQSWLLLNSPNDTQLPTLDSAQYASSSASFPLVALQQAGNTTISGVWTVGVWSNASSAFTIIAASAGSSQPMQLGVAYPGYLRADSYQYYSVYLDPLLVTSDSSLLDLELNSLSGDADLYCSDTVKQPNASFSRWRSTNSGSDSIIILLSTVPGDTVYCAVHGFVDSQFIFSALLGDVDATPILLTAGEPQQVRSAGATTQAYSFVFPATAYVVTLSVVSDVGSTRLYIGPYGTVSSPTTRWLVQTGAQTTQLQQLYASALCGVNNTLAIPGSSPPLCEMVVNVLAPMPGVYVITASAAAQVVALTPGEPTEWEASPGQPAYFSFRVPDNLFNLTMVVTITNGASGLNLTAGVNRLTQFLPLWTAAQQPGSNVLVWQLDWTDPVAYRNGLSRYAYDAVLTATDGPVTFSIVYTTSNGSTYSDSIVRLQDGVPQEGVTVAAGYGFYYYQPPAAAGAPYSVVLSMQWLSGSGVVRLMNALAGPFAGPVQVDASGIAATSGSTLTIEPTSSFACNFTRNPDCGYAISVQIDPQSQQQQQGVYVLTASTTNWVRALYAGNPPQSSVVSAAASDYFQTPVYFGPQNINPQLLYVLTVQAGVLSVFASNTTSSPNATTAQRSWPAVSSTAVLSFPVASQSSTTFLTVTCMSMDGTACQYSFRAKAFSDSPNVFDTASVNGNPAEVPLPAGGSAVVVVQLPTTATTYGYVLMQADAEVGTVQLFARCAATSIYNDRSEAPNATFSTWQSTSSPASIELANFSVTASRCAWLLLSVRASGDQSALAYVSVSAAGAQQRLVGVPALGLVTPAHPASYFYYSPPASDPTRVITFNVAARSSSAGGGAGAGVILGGNCSTDQLSLVVSTVTQYPNASLPSSYNFSATPVTLAPGMPVDLTIVLNNYTRPLGSVQAATYYVAVQSRVPGLTCQYQLEVLSSWQRQLQVGVTTTQPASQTARGTIYFATPFNSSTSFALQMFPNRGTMFFLVGVNSSPSPADPSTYFLLATYNSTGAVTSSSGLWTAPPIYVPASACAAYALDQACTIVVALATSSPSGQFAYVTPLSSAGATWLPAPDTPISPLNATARTTTFQFSLSTASQLVTVSVNSSSATAAVNVSCSYQYVTPSLQFSDWSMSQAAAAASGGGLRNDSTSSTSQLSFNWTAQLQTNAGSQYAAAANTCYCTVDTAGAYTIAYDSTLLPSPSAYFADDTGLSSGTLAAAVVVPIAAVLLLVGVVWWVRRHRDYCADLADKARTHSRSHGQSSELDGREVSMAEMSSQRGQSGQLMSGGWRSDA